MNAKLANFISRNIQTYSHDALRTHFFSVVTCFTVYYPGFSCLSYSSYLPFSELAIINKCHTGNGTLKTMSSSTSFIQHDWANTAEGRDMMSCLFTRNKQRLRTFGKPY